jgi:hypothetical protein
MLETSPDLLYMPETSEALQALQLAAARRLDQLVLQQRRAEQRQSGEKRDTQQPSGAAAPGNGKAAAAAAAVTNAGSDMASVLWCLGEFEAQTSGAATPSSSTSSDEGAADPTTSGSSFVQLEFLESVAGWILAAAAVAADTSSSGGSQPSGAIILCGVVIGSQQNVFAGPDGVSQVWGFGKLAGSWARGAGKRSKPRELPSRIGEALDALCAAVAENIAATTAGEPMSERAPPTVFLLLPSSIIILTIDQASSQPPQSKSTSRPHRPRRPDRRGRRRGSFWAQVGSYREAARRGGARGEGWGRLVG